MRGDRRNSRRSPAAPAISLRPVSGGVEITARYITRASERAKLRSRLYHIAIGLLGGTTSPMATSP